MRHAVSNSEAQQQRQLGQVKGHEPALRVHVVLTRCCGSVRLLLGQPSQRQQQAQQRGAWTRAGVLLGCCWVWLWVVGCGLFGLLVRQG